MLRNDTDPDGDSMTAMLLGGPTHGTLSFDTNGAFTYTPYSNYIGTDEFTYFASDWLGVGSSATVRIGVTNAPPVAVNDSYATPQNIVLTGNVLSNDSDPDGDPLTATLSSGPTHGSLTLNANGSFTYTPSANYIGYDEFTYVASDGHGGTATGHVSINVNGGNHPPVTANDTYSTPRNTPLTGNVLSNDTDPDGDPLAATLSSGPTHGSLTLNANGSFTYTPSANYIGYDEFTYVASDGHGGTATGHVSINVNGGGGNAPPVAVDDTYSTPRNTSFTGNVLSNDSDPDGDPLTTTLQSGPTHGTLSLNANGSFTYTPSSNYIGYDEFFYVVSDGHGGTATGRVSIYVNNFIVIID